MGLFSFFSVLCSLILACPSILSVFSPTNGLLKALCWSWAPYMGLFSLSSDLWSLICDCLIILWIFGPSYRLVNPFRWSCVPCVGLINLSSGLGYLIWLRLNILGSLVSHMAVQNLFSGLWSLIWACIPFLWVLGPLYLFIQPLYWCRVPCIAFSKQSGGL